MAASVTDAIVSSPPGGFPLPGMPRTRTPSASSLRGERLRRFPLGVGSGVAFEHERGRAVHVVARHGVPTRRVPVASEVPGAPEHTAPHPLDPRIGHPAREHADRRRGHAGVALPEDPEVADGSRRAPRRGDAGPDPEVGPEGVVEGHREQELLVRRRDPGRGRRPVVQERVVLTHGDRDPSRPDRVVDLEHPPGLGDLEGKDGRCARLVERVLRHPAHAEPHHADVVGT